MSLGLRHKSTPICSVLRYFTPGFTGIELMKISSYPVCPAILRMTNRTASTIAPFSATAEAGLCSDSSGFQCADGTCVSVDVKCDGTPDCPDASDETHALCYNHYCHPSLFRCAYGGCVDGAAPCGDHGQCFDNSDIRLLRCRNKTAVVDGKFNCENGEKIQLYQLCDGEKNCADGTDESVRACAGRRCGRGQFQCKYGACVAANAMCDANGHHDCADGSDEDDVLCNRPQTVIPDGEPKCNTRRSPEHGRFVIAMGPSRPSQSTLSVTVFVECTPPYRLEVPEEAHCELGLWSAPIPECKLPPAGSNLCKLPYQGLANDYTVPGMPNAVPEMAFDNVTLINVRCKPPYTLIGPTEISCYHGHWSSDPSHYCEYFCEVPRDPSVTYYCGDNFDQKCGDLVSSGGYALPKCNDHYHSTSKLQSMKCFNNGWMYIQSCEPDEESTTITASTEPSIPNPNESTKKCVLPSYPQFGSYSVAGWPNVRPGMTFDSVTVNVTCDAPMRPTGPVEMRCSNGQWSVDTFTTCWYFCEVPRHPSVTYYCGDHYDEPCDDFVISDTEIRPKCNEYYKSTQMMLDMHCIQGNFPFIETCDLDVSISRHGNNVTLRLGKKLVLHLSGTQYSGKVDLNSETVADWIIPEPTTDTQYDDVY